MGLQTDVNFRSDSPIRPGMTLSNHADCISRQAGALSPKVVDITITAVNDAVYNLIVPGLLQAHTLTFTASADTSAEEIRDGLIAEADLVDDVVENLHVYDNGDNIRIEARTPGNDFTVDASDGNLSAATITEASEGQRIGFGLAVMAGPKPGTCVLPTRGGDGEVSSPFLGVSLVTSREAVLPAQNTEEHGPLQTVPIQRTREATVQVIDGLNPKVGEPVHVYTTLDARQGKYTNASDGTNTVPVVGVKWTEGYRGKNGVYQVATAYFTNHG